MKSTKPPACLALKLRAEFLSDHYKNKKDVDILFAKSFAKSIANLTLAALVYSTNVESNDDHTIIYLNDGSALIICANKVGIMLNEEGEAE